MSDTQLLCTFCTTETLEHTLRAIQKCYTIAFNTIYVLENVDEPKSLCCTYNIETTAQISDPIPPSTISLHRKKISNTLYTINALNKLIAEKNNGKLDKSFPVEWSELENCILVTQYGHLKRINTKVLQIISLENESGD